MNRYENQMEEISKDEIQEELPSMVELGWDSIFTNPSQEEIQSYNGRATKRSPYLYGWFTLSDETKYTEYMVDFKVGHLPKGTYCCLGNWQMDYSTLERQYKNVRTEYEGVNAYAGFQNIYNGDKTGIMSFWDVFYEDEYGVEQKLRAKRIYPKEATSKEEFDGEGTGAHCSVPYAWEANHWYRMHLRCGTSQSTGNTTVEQWVCDLETEEYTLVCAYDTGVKNTLFKGSIAVFLENYMPNHAGDVRSMEICNAKYLDASTNQWTALTTIYVGSANGLPEYEGSYDFGVADGHLWMITSGVGGDWFGNGKGKKATYLSLNGGSQ